MRERGREEIEWEKEERNWHDYKRKGRIWKENFQMPLLPRDPVFTYFVSERRLYQRSHSRGAVYLLPSRLLRLLQ